MWHIRGYFRHAVNSLAGEESRRKMLGERTLPLPATRSRSLSPLSARSRALLAVDRLKVPRPSDSSLLKCAVSSSREPSFHVGLNIPAAILIPLPMESSSSPLATTAPSTSPSKPTTAMTTLYANPSPWPYIPTMRARYWIYLVPVVVVLLLLLWPITLVSFRYSFPSDTDS